MPPGRIDFDKINAHALAAYPGLLLEWFPNGKVVSGELCVGDWSGNPGNSLKINVKTGVGKDWAGGEKGVSDPVATYARRFSVDMGEAARCIAARLGIGEQYGLQREHAEAAEASRTTVAEQREARPKHQPGEVDPERAAKVAKLLQQCTGIKGTPGERYFRNRGLRGAPGARWRPMPRSQHCAGSVVTTATDGAGTVLAVQQVYITADGRKAAVDVVKRTNKVAEGWNALAACRLPPHPSQADGPIVAMEGYEDACTIRQETGLECWACYGIANIGAAPFPTGRPVIVARDNDDPGSDADKAIIKVLATLIERGYSVLCARPPLGVKDANALLQDVGPEAVVEMINHAKPVADLRLASDEGLPEAINGDPVHDPDDAPPGSTVPAGDPMFAELSGFMESDTGNAKRILTRFGDRIIHAEGMGWHVYEKGAWRFDETQRMLKMAQIVAVDIMRERTYLDPDGAGARAKWSLQSQMAGHCSSMLKLAAPWVSKPAGALDPDPMLLNCANGYVDLTTGKLHEHDARLLMTQQVPVVYDTAAKCPTWQKFLSEIFPGDPDLVAYVQRAIGYSFTGDTSEQVMFLCHGIGANGKNTLLDTVAALASGYWKKTVTTMLMAKERQSAGAANPELAMLRGARLVTASESGEHRRLDEALVKEVTGDASITVRFLYGQPFTFTPRFKLWLATNHRPDIRGTDEGIWRRMKLLPFAARFYRPDDPDAPEGGPFIDKMLPAKLLAELPGILAWIVRGAVQWHRDGLGEPTAVREATGEYRREQDIVGTFLEECCDRGASLEIKMADLRGSYNAWAKRNGYYEMSARAFGAQVRSHAIRDGRSRTGDRTYVGVDLKWSEKMDAPR